MMKFLRAGLVTAVVAFLFGALTATESKAQVNEILTRMDNHYNALTSLRANLKMFKYNAQIDESDTREGALILLPPKGSRKTYLRINWTKPDDQLAVIDGSYYKLYQPRLKQMYEGKVDNKKKDTKVAPILSFTTMSKAQLRTNFDLKYLGQETVQDGRLTWHLELTPKTAQDYKTADIWVDGNGMPIQVKINEGNGDSTTLLLSNLEKNIKIDGSVFDIKPKEKYKTIQG